MTHKRVLGEHEKKKPLKIIILEIGKFPSLPIEFFVYLVGFCVDVIIF